MVVMPTFAHGQDSNPPTVDAIVSGGKAAISKLAQMAYYVQPKRCLHYCKTRKQTAQSYLPTKQCPEQTSKSKADSEADVVSTSQVIAAIKHSVDWILDQILRLSNGVDVVRIVLFAQPAEMCIKQTIARRVRIEHRIVMSVVRSVNGSPPDWRTFKREITAKYKEVLYRLDALKRPVRQQTMVTKSDSHGMYDEHDEE